MKLYESFDEFYKDRIGVGNRFWIKFCLVYKMGTNHVFCQSQLIHTDNIKYRFFKLMRDSTKGKEFLEEPFAAALHERPAFNNCYSLTDIVYIVKLNFNPHKLALGFYEIL